MREMVRVEEEGGHEQKRRTCPRQQHNQMSRLTSTPVTRFIMGFAATFHTLIDTIGEGEV